jgi:hypothetical protein
MIATPDPVPQRTAPAVTLAAPPSAPAQPSRQPSSSLSLHQNQPTLSFEKARSVLSALSDKPYEDGTELIDVIMSLELYTRSICDHPEVPSSELLQLLDVGGVIAEFGARCLYLRTGRDELGWQPAGANGAGFLTDRADWAAYLQRQEG